VAIAGDLQSELGCSGDWQPDCANTELGFDADDGLWQATFNVPAGSWQYKAPLNDSWDENYGAGGVLNGDNIVLDLAAATDVKFYYDHETHWVTDNVNSTIAVVAGSFQSALGCPGDWQPWCLQSWMQDPDGDGIYAFATDAIPAGDYELKVALNETWDINFPGSNVPFSVSDGDVVLFTYDSFTNAVTVTVDSPPPPGPASVTIVGSLQDELGCPGEWQPECAATYLGFDGEDDVWQGVFTLPAGSYEYKAALDDSWDENYGAGGVQGGPNIALDLAAETAVKFYYDHKSHWVTDNVNSVIATAVGSFQDELGCAGDWQPWCLRSWLQDLDGDDVYTYTTNAIPAGSYEFKVALDEDWTVSYPASNVPFSVNDGQTVTFSFDASTNGVDVTIGGGGEPGDELLVRPPVRTPISNESFYFVLPDRFDNGDQGNDTGGDSSGDPLINGFLPTDKGYYHGGDLAGLTGKLDYLASLGVTALWMTPQFTNRPVMGDGTIPGSSAGYHGYWQVDLTEIDPHFGSNAEMQSLVSEAHSRGIKVFLDIVVNHTGDVISFAEGTYTYRNKDDYPYLDASGVAFDDRDFAGTGTFPPLDPAISFPYTPAFATPDLETAKSPAWLNDPIYYHNRGNSTFVGENSLYGDFFGLDDLFTEHPDVVNGMIDVHKAMITEFGIDGFRLDTAKHVNDEFWEAFVPEILGHAAAQGIPDFFVFGEVFDPDAGFLSRFTTELPLPSVLDFGFDGSAKRFAAFGTPTDELRDLFASDDYFTDMDSNAHQLVKFIGNHDLGRLGHSIDSFNPGAPDAERLARVKLAYALSYFSRGVPLVYYGDEQGFVGDGGDKDARQDMMPSLVASYNDDDLIGTAATTADANFDPAHPLYQSVSDYAALRAGEVALRQGAQIHRYSEAAAGIYAFSRIDRVEQVELIVVLNNSSALATASFSSDSPSTTFTEIYPGGGPDLVADGVGNLTVQIPALDFAVYRANDPVALPSGLPAVSVSAPIDGDVVLGRIEVAAQVDAGALAEVTFAVSTDGGTTYDVIGTDDNAPFRVFYDTGVHTPGDVLTFKAIVVDLLDNLSSDKVTVTVGDGGGGGEAKYAVIHYSRADGDYGDHTTGDFNDFWGLHLWGDIEETIEWTSPKPFLGEDDFGRFAWVELTPGASNIGFIVHRGDTKDGTNDDRFFNPSVTPEIWLKSDDAATYTSQAEAQGFVTIHYHRDDGDYGTPSPDYNTFWGLHLWGDAIDPSEATDNKDPGPDQSLTPLEQASVWIQSGDEEIYPQRGAAEDVATIHYHRPDGDYGDPTSSDFNDFWGLHVWEGALNPNPGWTDPVRWDEIDGFGPVFRVDLVDGAPQLAYILHRGDNKDPGPDQFLVFDQHGYEVWQISGADPDDPYVLPVPVSGGANPGNLAEQRAYWVGENTIAWAAATSSANSYSLHYAPTGGLAASDSGITGGFSIALTVDPAGLPTDVTDKFPHLSGLPALIIDPVDLPLVPEILKGQIAVSAVNGDGLSVDATGLQIPGVLDDLYTYDGVLGVSWESGEPTIRVWAPTAKTVTLHLFDDSDPATASTASAMSPDPATGVWGATGDATWTNKYYLFEVEVYVHSTGQVENNLVTDPYSYSLATNSARSQIVDLSDPSLQPAGWETLEKPPLLAPEDISIYEIHVRDFSVNDPLVPEEIKGTFKAFTLEDTYGTNHLEALEAAGLSHLHLLPSFDIATVNEDRATWQEPDPAVLETYPPDSEEQQAAVTATENLDGFNWGYDPFHYTVPEGSYATDPDGSTRIVEFREMVQALNQKGLRVVMDVVYNHTNAAGQSEKSVLDRIVPGYYHRLNDQGGVETSSCCPNTASEHNMMEKLMVDSLVTWAKEYKVDAFRFDLMGHHMKRNMESVRAALDALTLAADGVDGQSIYLYGEGWNFGEVADNARGVNATQLNMPGTGIGTFSDRQRDAVRGGGPFDGGDDLIRRQGFANGLYYDPNALNSGSMSERDILLLLSDQIRVGMTGNLADYRFIDRNGKLVSGSEVDYNGQPAGYTLDPQEVITYISKHDNQTLYDNNVYKAPVATSTADRVRIQNVGLSTVLLGQGVPFLHAGSDLLRSKSLDRDSFNSGDWFNRLDFTYQENNFGVGLPVAGKNQDNWPIMAPLLADPNLVPLPEDIAQSAALLQELLEIRYSSPLFRLETAAEIMDRVAFHNTGSAQIPGLVVMSIIDEVGTIDRGTEWIVTLVNANDAPATFPLPAAAGLELSLHPVQAASVDPVVQTSAFDSATGTFYIPGRTTAVFRLSRSASEQIDLLIEDVRDLVADGSLSSRGGWLLERYLSMAKLHYDEGRPLPASLLLEAFISRVQFFVHRGYLSAEDGESLIAAAEEILLAISGGS
jgi:pullulanase-type alpha-1,6-glucosidase